jgi:hypothetical protein
MSSEDTMTAASTVNAIASGDPAADSVALHEQAARAVEGLAPERADLNLSHPLPVAPWFPADQRWTARYVLLHIISETAQHAGHADIIRESLDGSKSMG